MVSRHTRFFRPIVAAGERPLITAVVLITVIKGRATDMRTMAKGRGNFMLFAKLLEAHSQIQKFSFPFTRSATPPKTLINTVKPYMQSGARYMQQIG